MTDWSSSSHPDRPDDSSDRPPFTQRLAAARERVAADTDPATPAPTPGDPRLDQMEAATEEARRELVAALPTFDNPTVIVGGGPDRAKEVLARVMAALLGCRPCRHVGTYFEHLGTFPTVAHLSIRWVGCRRCLDVLVALNRSGLIDFTDEDMCDWCDETVPDPLRNLVYTVIQIASVTTNGYACRDCQTALTT